MEQNALAIRDDEVELDRWEWEGGYIEVLDEEPVLPPSSDSTDNAARDAGRQTRSDFPDSSATGLSWAAGRKAVQSNWPAG